MRLNDPTSVIGVDSNQAVVAIAAEQTRLSEPVAKEVGLSFVFGPPGRSLVPFRPESEELDVDMRSDTAYWRPFRSLEP